MRRRKQHQPNLFALCQECGRAMEKTESGFLVCPAGHGRLHAEPRPDDDQPEPCGSFFDYDPVEE